MNINEYTHLRLTKPIKVKYQLSVSLDVTIRQLGLEVINLSAFRK